MSQTIKNLETAFAGESQAYTKYTYFATLADKMGQFEVADHFYVTAEQELKHAHSHLNLLIGEPEVLEMLQMAIDGETYEYTTMYPEMFKEAMEEGRLLDAQEAKHQIEESKLHAEDFRNLLELAAKRFDALARIERKHANGFQRIQEAANDE
jgi:rubrerythrin